MIHATREKNEKEFGKKSAFIILEMNNMYMLLKLCFKRNFKHILCTAICFPIFSPTCNKIKCWKLQISKIDHCLDHKYKA